MTTQNSTSSPIQKFISDYGHYLTLVVALAATFGSLYFSEIRQFEPCRLCWFQRIMMYPIGILVLVGIIKQDEYLPNYVLPLSLIGICISVYHILIQNGIIVQSNGCTTVLCSIKYINWFGFISIPVLAGTAFLIINILMFASLRYANQDE
ncbi:MAG: disulfide bond formation protein DsbB [Cellvibrionaceae bacterium]|jgi:disulfide bond formation protein DsbB